MTLPFCKELQSSSVETLKCESELTDIFRNSTKLEKEVSVTIIKPRNIFSMKHRDNVPAETS